MVTDTERSILAIDLGTSETKVGLLAPDGRLLGVARETHTLSLDPASGCAEQDPEDWWSAVRSATERLRPAMSGPVGAICCVGQGPTLVVADATGRATRPAITWLDHRPAEQATALEAATGMSGWGLGILPAARWVEVNDPKAASQARWYLNAWEWAALRMTARAAMTRAPGQQLPDPERAAAAGLASDRLPAVAATGTIIGGLTAAVGAELGLDPGTPVIAGTVDSFASFHGAGLVDARRRRRHRRHLRGPGRLLGLPARRPGGLGRRGTAPRQMAGGWCDERDGQVARLAGRQRGRRTRRSRRPGA